MMEDRKSDGRRYGDIVETSVILDWKSYLEIYMVLAKQPVHLATISLHTLVESTLNLPCLLW